ncbi:hypothetical protein [Kaarinaea lacus]
MRHSIHLKLLAVFLVVAWLIACAPVKPYVLIDTQRDPEFILVEMLATGLVLGGVTVTAFPVTVEERNAITAQLEDVLTQFSFYRVLTPDTLAKKVSQEKYQKILNYFEEHRTIPADEIKNLKSIYTPARYILFVNIDSNTVSQRKVHNPDSIDFQSVRTIVATLNIISLDTELPALFTRISLSDVNSTSVQRLRGGGGAGLFGGVIAQMTFGGFPDPPPLENTLYKVFLAVADQVPSN